MSDSANYLVKEEALTLNLDKCKLHSALNTSHSTLNREQLTINNKKLTINNEDEDAIEPHHTVGLTRKERRQ